MGRKMLYPVKKLIGFDHALEARIDEWRRQQSKIPDFSDAVRELIDNALNTEGIS